MLSVLAFCPNTNAGALLVELVPPKGLGVGGAAAWDCPPNGAAAPRPKLPAWPNPLLSDEDEEAPNENGVEFVAALL